MRIHRPSRLFARHARPVALVSILAILTGCSSGPKPSAPPPPHYLAKKITDAAALDQTYQPVERLAADALATAFAKGSEQSLTQTKGASTQSAKSLNVLVLSGGGQYAAFAGGILVGWSASGKRPDFDVVTGISSGALVAVYAYLGPKYDSQVQRLTSTLKSSDMFVFRPLVCWMKHDSIGSSEPLQRFAETEYNDECLDDIRNAHRSGRRLFVGTMNQRTSRLVIWDLGAIACGPQPDANRLVRKILVAACSIPGMVPSVDFDVEVDGIHYHEQHVDGGAVAQAFVRFGPEIACPHAAKPDAKWLAGSNLYAIAGGKLYADVGDEKLGLLCRVTSTISATLYSLYRADLWRLYSLCAVSGMNFHHAVVPEETKISFRSTEFNSETMRDLFKLGYDAGARGDCWRQTPPGYEVGEAEIPRAGCRFTIP